MKSRRSVFSAPGYLLSKPLKESNYDPQIYYYGFTESEKLSHLPPLENEMDEFDHIQCIVSNWKNSQSDFNILLNYSELLSKWPSIKDDALQRTQAVSKIVNMENTFEFLDKTLKNLIENNSKISSLQNQLQDKNLYVLQYGDIQQKVHISLNCAIDLKYIKYIELYGIPDDGIFHEELLHVL